MSAPQNVTIIDSRVGDIAAVLAGLPAGERVFVLDGAHDGLGQISALLAGIDNIAALHIVSHGSAGALNLGDGVVDAAALAAHADDLAAIGHHLAPGGDILLYGCDVAAGAAGAAFVDAFAALTGADVAASTDVTGAATLGGNWTLEAHAGAIEAQTLAIAGFQGTLDTVTGDGTNNTLNGTPGDDIINGLGGNDTIFGFDGDDVIDGGTGADAMSGGLGDDIYYVDQAGDTVAENTGEGTDTVRTTISYGLGDNVENLTLLGGDPLSGFGNTLDNVITGNAAANLLNGASGNDYLDGGAGADTLVGGIGNDTFVLDNPGDVVVENDFEGRDTVRASFSYVLGSAIENLVLLGSDSIDGVGNDLGNSITGNGGANILSGEGGNDILDGGAGADRLIGGTGNDTFIVDQLGDVVIERAGEGTDTIQTALTYTLIDNIERLTLTGSDAVDGTGNAVANVLTGNDGANTLTGLDGNDTLDGGAGDDTLIGGTGDDTYVVDSAGDVVQEQVGEGSDSVQASVSYTLASNVENLSLTGLAAIDATGNALDNDLTGNDAANVLTGLDGNDVLDGGLGADTLIGGKGDDSYVVDNAGDVVTEVDGEGSDVVNASVSWTLGTALENLVLTGTDKINGTGNGLVNSITGNATDNIIDGGAGADTMTGGAGNDTYYVDTAGDTIVELAGAGTDSVISSASIVLAANVDNLSLTGSADLFATGNGDRNTIIGNSGNNLITGGGGIDSLDGGGGSDLYIVERTKDSYHNEIHDSGGSGVDELRITATTSGQIYLGSGDTGLERIVIGTGTGASADTSGTAAISVFAQLAPNGLTIIGNAGANKLTGTAFDDVLDGGTGLDTFYGGAGNDTYYVDNTASSGTDTVIASVNFKLGNAVEILTLTGSGNLTGTGGTTSNTLNGNSGNNLLDGGRGDDTLNGFDGNDILIGGAGSDALLGGTGADTFRFTVTPKASNGLDSILDFSSGEGDRIEFAKAAFRGLGLVAGQFNADQFWSGAGVNAAHDLTDRVIYNTTTGALWYDADGTGRSVAVQIAQLGAGVHPALAFSDLYLVV